MEEVTFLVFIPIKLANLNLKASWFSLRSCLQEKVTPSSELSLTYTPEIQNNHVSVGHSSQQNIALNIPRSTNVCPLFVTQTLLEKNNHYPDCIDLIFLTGCQYYECFAKPVIIHF